MHGTFVRPIKSDYAQPKSKPSLVFHCLKSRYPLHFLRDNLVRSIRQQSSVLIIVAVEGPTNLSSCLQSLRLQNRWSENMASSSGSPCAVRAPIAAPNENKGGWATKEDWIKHQRLIGQLYEKQTLAKVMSYMASQHGFRATCVIETIQMIFNLADGFLG